MSYISPTDVRGRWRWLFAASPSAIHLLFVCYSLVFVFAVPPTSGQPLYLWTVSLLVPEAAWGSLTGLLPRRLAAS